MSVTRAIPECFAVPPRVVAVDGAVTTVEAVCVFPPSFPGFAGHFPGDPLLPGIVQIMAVVQAASHDSNGVLQGVKRCKFVRPVRPMEELAIAVDITEKADVRFCKATLTVQGEATSTISLTLAMQ